MSGKVNLSDPVYQAEPEHWKSSEMETIVMLCYDTVLHLDVLL